MDVASLPRSELRVLLLGFDPCHARPRTIINFVMWRILLGLLLVAAGSVIVIKAEAIYNFFGPVQWAEDKLGSEGGSRLFYKIIGILIIFLGFSVATGLWFDILNGFARMIGLAPKQ